MTYRLTFDSEADWPDRDARYVRVRGWLDDETLGIWVGSVDGNTIKTKPPMSGDEPDIFWRSAAVVLAERIRAVFEGGEAPENWYAWSRAAHEVPLDFGVVSRSAAASGDATSWARGDLILEWS